MTNSLMNITWGNRFKENQYFIIKKLGKKTPVPLRSKSISNVSEGLWTDLLLYDYRLIFLKRLVVTDVTTNLFFHSNLTILLSVAFLQLLKTG